MLGVASTITVYGIKFQLHRKLLWSFKIVSPFMELDLSCVFLHVDVQYTANSIFCGVRRKMAI